ncbi:MAG: hypothetical protein ACI3W5_11340 [Faecousia sp.]|jgi:hypothetical protein
MSCNILTLPLLEFLAYKAGRLSLRSTQHHCWQRIKARRALDVSLVSTYAATLSF